MWSPTPHLSRLPLHTHTSPIIMFWDDHKQMKTHKNTTFHVIFNGLGQQETSCFVRVRDGVTDIHHAGERCGFRSCLGWL